MPLLPSLLKLTLRPRLPRVKDPSLPDVHQVELRLLGPINELSAAQLCAQLRHFNEQGAKCIDIRITSGGGSLSDGLLIVDTMNEVKDTGTTIRTMVEGVAASAATLVSVSATAGERYIHKNSRMLLHRARAPLNSPAGMDEDELKTHISNLKALEACAMNVYKEFCPKLKANKKLFKTAIAKNEWFNANECKDTYGLVDKIGPLPVVNMPAQQMPNERGVLILRSDGGLGDFKDLDLESLIKKLAGSHPGK